MVKNDLTKTKIDSKTIFDVGECIKNIINNNCYLICAVGNNSLILMNVHDGHISKEQIQNINNGNYEKIPINPIVYKTLLNQTTFCNLLSGYPKSALDDIVDDYALQICINAIDKRRGKIMRVDDYPSIAIAANVKQSNYVVTSCSEKWHNSTWNTKFLSLLKNKGWSLGSTGCSTTQNIIGHCAEQHAVNDLITLHADTDINNVVFSKAIRPRTGEKRPYCDNCCKILGLKN